MSNLIWILGLAAAGGAAYLISRPGGIDFPDFPEWPGGGAPVGGGAPNVPTPEDGWVRLEAFQLGMPTAVVGIPVATQLVVRNTSPYPLAIQLVFNLGDRQFPAQSALYGLGAGNQQSVTLVMPMTPGSYPLTASISAKVANTLAERDDALGWTEFLPRLLSSITVIPQPAAAAGGRLLGDVDGDGLITMNDTLLILRFYAGLAQPASPEQAWAADVDGDGVISPVDANMVQRHVLGSYVIPVRRYPG